MIAQLRHLFSGLVISALALGFAALSAPASAQVVSYNYDGVYQGVTSVSAGLSDASCRSLPLTRIEIRNGALRAWEGSWQTVKGLVTQDGFFNADYYFPGRPGVVFEGTIDGGGRLTGGIFDGGCAWVVEMTVLR